MRASERGILLLTCPLGDPERRPLTVAQFRVLAKRASQMEVPLYDRELEASDIVALGYDTGFADHVLTLLSQEDDLEHYLRRSQKANCGCITRISPDYPRKLRIRLGLDCPGTLWTKGNTALLESPMLSLVGSRDILPDSKAFAQALGIQAALQGYTLVSGNARGADRTAQNACLRAGGKVISVVADELEKQPNDPNVLYVSEDGFDLAFTSQRALHRNHVIHAFGEKTFVAQCSLETGGTWDGTVKNLRFGWSSVFCFQDGSEAIARLIQMGAEPVTMNALHDLRGLQGATLNFFE